jgi:hypothetical protein
MMRKYKVPIAPVAPGFAEKMFCSCRSPFSLDTGGGLRLRRRVPTECCFKKKLSFEAVLGSQEGEPEWRCVMDNFTFGITMLVCGMGGTILTLFIMSLVMGLLGKLFPEKPAKKEE